MDSIRNFIDDLEKEKVYLTMNGDDIEIESLQSTITEQLLQKIKNEKIRIIEYLKSSTSIPRIFFNIEKAPEQEFYPLSYGQKRLWTLGQLTDGNIAYNAHDLYEFNGDLNFQAFEDSFRMLIERHESLRTIFRQNSQGDVYQHVRQADNFPFTIYLKDFSKANAPNIELQKFIADELVSPFDLENGPLIRATLVQIDRKRHVFVYIMHHIISDGWSRKVMIRDLLACYNQITSNRDETLPALRIQYKDYAFWQRGKLRNEKLEEDKAYWLKRFEGELPVLNLPTDRIRPAIKTYNGGLVKRWVKKPVVNVLTEIAKQSGATLYMGLLSAVKVLLYRYTNQTDIIIGCPVAGRDHVDLENQIGFFVNTVALRTQFTGNDSYNQLLKNIMQVTIEAYDHQAYPFDEIVDQVQTRVDVSRHPLFSVMVALQNTDIGNFDGGVQLLSGVKVNLYDDNELVTSKFDLLFDFVEIEGDLLSTIQYNSDLYDRETVERMGDHLIQLFGAIAQNLDLAIDRIDYMTGQEKDKLLVQFNNTKLDYPKDQNIVSLFETCVERYTDTTALIFERESISYGDLNQRANRIAHYLTYEAKITKQESVGILQGRGIDYIVTILGILKAGGAYIPLEMDAPDDRLKFIIQEAVVKTLIIEKTFGKRVRQFLNIGSNLENILVVDSDDLRETFSGYKTLTSKNALKSYAVTNLTVDIQPDSRAYIIYTSGSTGTPKGVIVGHKSVVRLVKNTNYISIDSNQTILGLSNFSFDGSVFDIFGALLNGAKLVITPQESIANPVSLNRIIQSHHVSVFFVTTTLFNALVEEGLSDVGKLACILFGGEQVSVSHVRKFKTLYPAIRLIHVYGPTENTTFSTYYDIKIVPESVATIPIGQGIANTTCYVLDDHQALQPIGVIGELYVGGEGLSSGYLNNPELTSAKFIANPFVKGEQLYKTGDLVRWLPSGQIEFVGRRDNQVKIRGFRIELGEIERVLRENDIIDDAIVLVKLNALDEKELCAYVVASQEVDTAALANYINNYLPSYMVPVHWIHLDKFPLNRNGKVDKHMLVSHSINELSNKEEKIEPRTETEIKVAAIWKKILGLEKVRLNDNFFERGGHSLKATKFVNQVYKDLGIQLDLRDLFTHTLLEDHVKLIETAIQSSYSGIERAKEAPCYPLSPSQRRLWIVSQFKAGNVAYNISGKYKFEGPLDKNALARAYRSLVERHEVLRTVFREDESGEVKQWIRSSHEFTTELNYVDLRNDPDAEDKIKLLAQQECERSFDLGSGPMVSANLYQWNDNSHVFIFVIHHIIADGWSVPVVIKELSQFYNAYRKETIATLRPLKIHYKDFSEWQLKQLDKGKLQEDRKYWLTKFEGVPPVLEMPTDKIRPALKSFSGGEIVFEINQETTQLLKSFVHKEGCTIFMGLLGAVLVLLNRYTKQEDIVIGSPIAGREHIDLEDQIGFYVNTLVLRTTFESSDSFRSLLANVRKVTLDAYKHQAFPFDELIKDLNLVRHSSRQPLFDVMVTLHNAETDKTDHWAQSLSDIKISGYKGEAYRNSKFDLNFDFRETESGVFAMLEYDTDLFNKETANRIASHLMQILEIILKQPDCSIDHLPYLTSFEQQQLLSDFNSTTIEHKNSYTVVDLFEKQVAKTPEHAALVFEENAFTYIELNQLANQFGRYLQETGVKSGDHVFMITDRSEWSVISMIGILKCGGVYIPVDKAWPATRIDLVLKEYKAKFVITDDDRLASTFENSIRLDRTLNLKDFNHENLECSIDRSSSSYIIYTSGSSGIPKGVDQTHLTLYNLMQWEINRAGLLHGQKHLQFSSFAFDSSLNDTFFALSTGGEVHVLSHETRSDLLLLRDYIIEKKIGAVSMPFAALNALFSEIHLDNFKDHSIRDIISTGEQLYVTGGLRKFLEENPSVSIFNLYGPSETHVVTGVHYSFSRQEIPIKATLGKPIDNTKIYILDGNFQLVPKGVEGEIYIGGSNLAVGYYGMTDMTKAVFIRNPLNSTEIVYRSGDIGKWLDNGEIEYLGRKDNQIKINGFRIELEEIELALKSCQLLEDAVVLNRPDNRGVKSLVAYITLKQQATVEVIRSFLKLSLPDYMVPSAFVVVDEIPLTSNGKVDKRELALKEGIEMSNEVSYVAPTNDVEEHLVKIWTEVLGLPEIGIKNNFFTLGGHSLKATIVLAKIYSHYGVRIPIENFFSFPTIEDQAKELTSQLWMKEQALMQQDDSNLESFTI